MRIQVEGRSQIQAGEDVLGGTADQPFDIGKAAAHLRGGTAVSVRSDAGQADRAGTGIGMEVERVVARTTVDIAVETSPVGKGECVGTASAHQRFETGECQVPGARTVGGGRTNRPGGGDILPIQAVARQTRAKERIDVRKSAAQARNGA